MRAEISFARSVTLLRASEKRIEKTLAQVSPIRKIAISITHMFVPRTRGTKDSIAITIDTLRNINGLVLSNKNAPRKVPIVLAIK